MASLYEEITSKMTGRFAMQQEDAELIERVIIAAGDGDYLEIGALYGGSVILAALVKQINGIKGDSYTIDPMIGYYGGKDPGSGYVPSAAILQSNADLFGVAIRLIKAKSHPYPAEDIAANVILIDGDHSAEACYIDWLNASKHSSKFVLFHDYHDENIKALVDGIVSDDWTLQETTHKMAVMVGNE